MKIRIATQADYPAIMEVWESSVKATHHFLLEEDFEYFKKLIPAGLLQQVSLHVLETDGVVAFMGTSGENLEMLFVAADVRGMGFGKILLQYAMAALGVKKVDVNEQNVQALNFYRKMGFQQVGRSEKDSMGKDYPLLHLEINPPRFFNYT